MICEHDDCYTCPYPDCIASQESEVNKQKKKRGRKPMDPELKKKKKQAYRKEYYKKNKERLNAYMSEYYKGHKEEYRERSRKCYAKKHKYSDTVPREC